MKLFEYEKTFEKLSEKQLEEIKGFIRRIYVAKSTVHRRIYYYDFRDNKNQFGDIRKLINEGYKNIDEIIEMTVNNKIDKGLSFKYFCSSVYHLTKRVNNKLDKAVPSQKEIIKTLIKNEFGNLKMTIKKNYKKELRRIKK